MNIDFETFQGNCRHCRWGFDEMSGTYDLTCRKVIPEGESWGICDAAHCPYCGTRSNNSTKGFPKGTVFISQVGDKWLVGKVTPEGRIKLKGRENECD